MDTSVVLLGDLDVDGLVDGHDVQALVIDPVGHPTKYPGGDLCSGDTDADGDMDIDDRAPFVNLLLGG